MKSEELGFILIFFSINIVLLYYLGVLLFSKKIICKVIEISPIIIKDSPVWFRYKLIDKPDNEYIIDLESPYEMKNRSEIIVRIKSNEIIWFNELKMNTRYTTIFFVFFFNICFFLFGLVPDITLNTNRFIGSNILFLVFSLFFYWFKNSSNIGHQLQKNGIVGFAIIEGQVNSGSHDTFTYSELKFEYKSERIRTYCVDKCIRKKGEQVKILFDPNFPVIVQIL